MARLIQQINNLRIMKYTKNDPYQGYLVKAPDGRVLEDRLTLPQARSWASRTKDFVDKKKPKMFNLHWSKPVYANQKDKVITGMNYFSPSIGFSKEDLQEIKNLRVGERFVEHTPLGDGLVVRRIQ